MRFSSVLAAGLVAARASASASASAFFIPPYVSDAVNEAKDELVSILAGVPRSVEVDCPGCPFAGIETVEWQANVENKIHLEFDASLSSGLSVNNQTVLSSAFAPPTPAVITAVQVRTSDGSSTQPLLLDFALERLEPLTDPQTPGNMIIPVRFTLFAIGGQPIKVDTIALEILRTDQSFSIGRISNIPFQSTPGAETCNGARFWSLCRLRALVSFRLRQMLSAARKHAPTFSSKPKGCHGGPEKHERPAGKMGFWQEGSKPHHKHHDEHHKHKHHHHHHHHHGHRMHDRIHRLGKMIHQALRFFIIPAMLGVIGGLMASAVGMLVGQCIVCLWQSFYRGARETRAQSMESQLVDVVVIGGQDEKDGLLFGQEGSEQEVDELPRYHDTPPEYRDGASDDVESQKVVGTK